MAERAEKGPIVRAIDRWDGAEDKALTPQSINLIVSGGCDMWRGELEVLSAQGLRARYLTEAARDRAAGGDATVPTPSSAGREATTMTQSALGRPAMRGWGRTELGCRPATSAVFHPPSFGQAQNWSYDPAQRKVRKGLGAESCRPATFPDMSLTNPFC